MSIKKGEEVAFLIYHICTHCLDCTTSWLPRLVGERLVGPLPAQGRRVGWERVNGRRQQARIPEWGQVPRVRRSGDRPDNGQTQLGRICAVRALFVEHPARLIFGPSSRSVSLTVAPAQAGA